MKGLSSVSPNEIAEVIRARLAAQLSEDLKAVERLASAISQLLVRTDDNPREWLRVRALSFEIERWYTAIESTLERALRSLDGTAPEGRSWHDDLLRNAGLAIDGYRPALVSQEAVERLREVMRFRHYVRHGYDREPNADRVNELGRVALAAHVACAASLGELRNWLTRT